LKSKLSGACVQPARERLFLGVCGRSQAGKIFRSCSLQTGAIFKLAIALNGQVDSLCNRPALVGADQGF